MIKTNSRILQNVSLLLNFLQISLLTYVFVKSKSIFQRFNLSMAWEKNMCRTYPSMTCRFYFHTYQFFLRWLYSWEWSTSKVNDLIFFCKKLDQIRMSFIVQVRFFYSNDLYLSAAKYESEVNHSTGGSRLMRISLLRISLLRFFKTITKIWLMRF